MPIKSKDLVYIWILFIPGLFIFLWFINSMNQRQPQLPPPEPTAPPIIIAKIKTHTPTPTPIPTPIRKPIHTPIPRPTPSPTLIPNYTGIQVSTAYNPATDFNNSLPKQTWKVNDSNIVLLKSPTIPPDKWTFRENIVAIIQPGEFITILKTQGILTKWIYVSLSTSPGGYPRARGWIVAKTITDATLW